MGAQRLFAAAGVAASTFAIAGLAPAQLAVTETPSGSELSLQGHPFRATQGQVLDLRSIAIPGSDGLIARWTEQDPAGGAQPFVALSLDGAAVARLTPASDLIRLRYAEFDPGRFVPGVAGGLTAGAGHDAWIVQYEAQPLVALDDAVAAAGARITRFLADNARIVRAPAGAVDAIRALPFVRWVGPYQPAYKLDESILTELAFGADDAPVRRYSIELLEDGAGAMAPVLAQLGVWGANVPRTVPEVGRLEAELTIEQVRQVALMGDVLFIDPWHPPENDMNIARQIGGANLLESQGFTGAGVRGEVFDSGILQTHQEFVPRPIMHTSSPVDSHGTSTYSIVFAQGVSAFAKGMLPEGTGIFASYSFVGNRYIHTRELVLPSGAYRAVFQTNSWGSGLTTAYTTASAELDRIVFDQDILITQSQSNDGTRLSRPEAWAKNVVSVGGVVHRNTLTKGDDFWGGGASIGPAADGRIKPDLTHFYDSIRAATSSSASAYTEFGGTSGATPIVAGHFGLVFEMWAKGVFGNEVSGGDVFDERPHYTVAKAIVINTADPYPFTSPSSDLSRAKQGWGMPDLAEAWNQRDKTFIINEDEPLTELETATYQLIVPAGEPQFRATMVYNDPSGTTSSTIHRINDLSLRVTSPTGAIYWGNSGLDRGHWTTAGGVENNRDTVENVFVQNPAAGIWTVEVIATEVNQDSHRETATRDADFALVVTGVDAAGVALALPFEEPWPSTTIALAKWAQVGPGALVSSFAPNPPSPPNVLLMANSATIASARIDAPIELLSTTPVQVSYWTQHRGVEAGKAMRIEYFRTFFQDWALLEEIVSDGVDQDQFVKTSKALPADGYGDDLRLRISVPGSDVADQWHIDDILLTTDAGCYADCDASGALDFFDFLCFQNAFGMGDPQADCDGTGALDFFDFLCFQNEFALGCP
ncbi:MAG: S8 family serine peptidase [Phycisphaerales bacterium JB039]